jgi:NDP-sugar pyrophosphorylase family protein
MDLVRVALRIVMTTIITSLNPYIKRLDDNGVNFGADYQRQCVESWIGTGAKVVSLNSRNEIKNLAKMGYDVNFLPVEVRPFEVDGRALPGIADAVQFAATLEDETVFIVNSDILFSSDVEYLKSVENMIGENDLVFANRIDINSLKSKSGDLYPYGYDVFAFHSSRGGDLVVEP